MPEEFPFTRPPGSDLSMFIQWKGTDLCADFSCPCGRGGHIDADFAYFVRCAGCGTIYEMGTQVVARRAEGATADEPCVITFGEDDDEFASRSGEHAPAGATGTADPAGAPRTEL